MNKLILILIATMGLSLSSMAKADFYFDCGAEAATFGDNPHLVCSSNSHDLTAAETARIDAGYNSVNSNVESVFDTTCTISQVIWIKDNISLVTKLSTLTKLMNTDAHLIFIGLYNEQLTNPEVQKHFTQTPIGLQLTEKGQACKLN